MGLKGPASVPRHHLGVFFTRSAASRQAGVETLRRLTERRDDRDEQTTWPTQQAQYDAVCNWGIPDHGQLQRVSAIGIPVFVANGDSDPMILPHLSYLLAGLIPHARVKIYTDAAHGFLFQRLAEFARDVDAFLKERRTRDQTRGSPGATLERQRQHRAYHPQSRRRFS